VWARKVGLRAGLGDQRSHNHTVWSSLRWLGCARLGRTPPVRVAVRTGVQIGEVDKQGGGPGGESVPIRRTGGCGRGRTGMALRSQSVGRPSSRAGVYLEQTLGLQAEASDSAGPQIDHRQPGSAGVSRT
jgi:hypothetical protein